MKSDVGKVVIGQCKHLRVSLPCKGQIVIEMTGGFLHPAQAVVGLAEPVKGISLGLQVVLPQCGTLVEIADGLFEPGIGERLCAELEQDFLLGFQDGLAWVRDALDGFQSGIIAACIHINLHQVIADFVGVRGVWEFIQKLFEDSYRFAEGGIGGLMDA